MQDMMQFIYNHYILILIWIFFVLTLISMHVPAWISKVEEISCHDAIQLMNKNNAIILDLRNSNDYHKGHIINSININVVDIKARNFNQINNKKDIPIIIVCSINIIAHSSAKKMLNFGFHHIYILKEGMKGWIRDNLPLI